MRHSRTTVFIGAIGALALMTILAAFLGYATTVIPRKYTFYISTALFAFFGLKMLKEGYDMDPNHGQEEYEEVSVELKKKEEEVLKCIICKVFLLSLCWLIFERNIQVNHSQITCRYRFKNSHFAPYI